jgi:cysteinyl-tRNA synthetase
LDEGRQDERIVADDYGKSDARDFAVWKGAKPGDESVGAVWDTPWGRGRPGWHLECSAMALAEVSQTVDLHLGGEDLIFPHHENEIAQSEGATGQPFVRHWIHTKHLKVNGQKMSKSQGNVLRVKDLIEEGVPPGSIRHQLLSAQYRTELNFTRAGLEASMQAIERLLDFESRLDAHPVGPESADTELPAVADLALAEFTEAMDDDLNVPGGIAALFRFVNRCNAILDATPIIASSELESSRGALASIDKVLGFLEVGRRQREVGDGLREWIQERIDARTHAREQRDWGAADRIRDELVAAGIMLEDGPDGTRWKRDGR